jgi:hypothetical protein
VEFALVFPLQLFLTLGLIQFCLVLVGAVLVDHAAFRAARVALVRPPAERGVPMRRAAAITLAPVAGLHDAAGPRDDALIPGWGPLRGSGRALDKVRARAFREDAAAGGQDLVAVLEFDYELVIPVVDALAGMLLSRLPEAEAEIHAFGRGAALEDPAGAGESATPYYDAIRARREGGAGEPVGLLRVLDGAPHLVLVRTCRLHMGPYETDQDE